MWRKSTTNDEVDVAFRFEETLAIVAAASLALIIGLMAGLSWQQCLILIFGVSCLVGGIVFTLLEMHRLTHPPTGGSAPSPATKAATVLRRIVVRSWQSIDPLPHHENYPECPGQDQGQRTSNLPGSTPLLEAIAARLHSRR